MFETTGNPLLDVAQGKRPLTMVSGLTHGRKFFAFGLASMRSNVIYNKTFLYSPYVVRDDFYPETREWETKRIQQVGMIYLELARRIKRGNTVLVTDLDHHQIARLLTQLDHHDQFSEVIPDITFYDFDSIIATANYKTKLKFEGDPRHPLDRAIYGCRVCVTALRYNFEIDWVKDRSLFKPKPIVTVTKPPVVARAIPQDIVFPKAIIPELDDLSPLPTFQLLSKELP